MPLEIIEIGKKKIAVLRSDDLMILEVQDALDMMADAGSHDLNCIIVNENNITPEFFDLKTGIAGEILQKFSTYNFRLAIVGDFSRYHSKSLRDFIYESNKYSRINFVNSYDEALEKLTK